MHVVFSLNDIIKLLIRPQPRVLKKSLTAEPGLICCIMDGEERSVKLPVLGHHNFLDFNCKQEVKKWRILQKAAVVAISFLAASAAHRSPGTA